MNRITKQILAVVGTAIFLTACETKDPIYETAHPTQGEITVTAGWDDIGEGITQPSGYTVLLGENSFQATNDSYTLPELVNPGNYTLYLYNRAEHMTVNGTVAAVEAAESGINPEPGWFFSGKSDVTVEKDAKQEFTVAMRQQVRELMLTIEPSGSTADKITSITGTLSGVAGAWDFATDSPSGEAMSVPLLFTKSDAATRQAGDNAVSGGVWQTAVRILGTLDNQQRLTGVVTFEGGSPGDMPLESDLSEALSAFNDNKKETLVLEGEVVETPSGTGFTGTIIDWKPAGGGSGIAN